MLFKTVVSAAFTVRAPRNSTFVFRLFLAQRLTHMQRYGRVLGEWCEWDGLRIIAGHIYANEVTQCTWGDDY